MARPIKDGVDYFPLDVTTDKKFRLIEAKYGIVGFGIIIKLLQSIYGEHGYYYEWDDDAAIIIAGENSSGQYPISPDDVKGIVEDAIKRGIFDADKFEEFKILTSRGIQRRYLEATKRRARVDFINDYLLLSDTEIEVYVNINWVYVNRNGGLCMQKPPNKSKEKESKVNKSKGNSSSAAAVPSDVAFSETTQNVINHYQQNIAPITPIVAHAIDDWLKDMEEGVLIYAIDEAAKFNKRNWKYIEAIIRNNHGAGRTTLAAVEDANRRRKNGADKTPNVYDDNGTDYEELERLLRERM